MDTAPLPLTDQIVIALDQVRIARGLRRPADEWSWTETMNRLLDRYAQGYR